MRTTTILAAFAVVAACYEREPVAPGPQDAGLSLDDSACGLACARLRDLGCPEGHPSVTGASCERTCTRASELRPLPLACWAQATNLVAAKACGSLRCVR